MSILLISQSFSGHANATRTLQRIIDSEVCDNIKTILKIIDSSKNSSTDPKQFVFEHCIENVNTLMPIVESENVVLIIYDFFSIEGQILAKKKGIPCICSIPAIISDTVNNSFQEIQVLEQLNMLEQLFEIRLPLPKYLSDGFYLEGDDNLVWGFKDIYKKLENIITDSTYHFVGSRSNVSNLKKMEDRSNIVYCSMGTVVVNSMLHLYMDNLIELYENIIKTCNYLNIDLILSCPSELFDKLPSKHLVFEHYEFSDQVQSLKRAKLFITHGGGNSFNESIICKCPMIVIPFFGDQFATSSYVNDHNLGFGYGSVSDFLVDCLVDDSVHSNLKHLYYGFYDKLANIMNISDSYRFPKNHNELNYQEIYRTIFKNIHPSKLFDKGDLLFGTTEDRQHFDYVYDMDFKIGKMKNDKYVTFDQLNLDHPVIIDQWNDLLRQYSLSQLSSNPNLEDILETLIEYKQHVSTQLGHNINKKIDVENEELIRLCCEGMKFFTENNNKIHFVFKSFRRDKNIGTAHELNYMLELLSNGKNPSHFVIWVYDELSGKYLICNKDNLFPEDEDVGYNISTKYERQFSKISNTFTDFVHKLNKTYVVWAQYRMKTMDSISDNLKNKVVKSICDIGGLRIIYPWSNDLNEIANIIQKQNVFNVVREERREQNKVIYLFCLTNDNFPFEIQLWPTIMYTCFEYEHDRLYKKKSNEEYSQERGDIIRKRQTELQNIMDAFEIIKY